MHRSVNYNTSPHRSRLTINAIHTVDNYSNTTIATHITLLHEIKTNQTERRTTSNIVIKQLAPFRSLQVVLSFLIKVYTKISSVLLNIVACRIQVLVVQRTQPQSY